MMNVSIQHIQNKYSQISQMQNVTLSKIPKEISDKKLTLHMSSFAEVKTMRRMTDNDGVENDIRRCDVI